MHKRRFWLTTLVGSAIALGASATAGGCGQNACDRAAAHEIECNVVQEDTTTSSSSGGNAVGTDCSGLAECEAGCLAKAPCSELKEFNLPDKAVDLKACLHECVHPTTENPQSS